MKVFYGPSRVKYKNNDNKIIAYRPVLVEIKFDIFCTNLLIMTFVPAHLSSESLSVSLSIHLSESMPVRPSPSVRQSS